MTPPRYPFPRASPLHPPPRYARLRREAPVARVRLWDDREAWLVTRHADVRAALRDPRLSASPLRAGYPMLSAARAAVTERQGSFNHLDGAEHRALRRMVSGAFTVTGSAALSPRVRELADRHLDRLLANGPPAELVSALALPVASETICAILGVPYADHEHFEGRSTSRFALRGSADPTPHRELLRYVDAVVAARLADGEGLVGHLGRHVAAGDLSATALADLTRLLLVNGFETMTGMTGLALLLLLQEPAVAEVLRDGSDDAVDWAVEELLRHASIVHLAPVRAAVDDLVLGGQRIRRGDGVIVSLPSANRDEEVFQDPDRLDPGREPLGHLAFGHGGHHCLGAALVRMQLAVVLRAALRRLPGLRLAVPLAQVRFKHDRAVYGVHRLDVTWT